MEGLSSQESLETGEEEGDRWRRVAKRGEAEGKGRVEGIYMRGKFFAFTE